MIAVSAPGIARMTVWFVKSDLSLWGSTSEGSTQDCKYLIEFYLISSITNQGDLAFTHAS